MLDRVIRRSASIRVRLNLHCTSNPISTREPRNVIASGSLVRWKPDSSHRIRDQAVDQPGPHAVPAFEDALSIEDLVHGAILALSPTAISNRSSLARVSSTPPCSIMPSVMEHSVLDSFIMSLLGEHDTLESFGLTSDPGHDLETLLARLTCSQPDEPCLTLLPQLQPSVDGILATLSPTDAEVFRSALDSITLISHTPPFAKRPPPHLSGSQRRRPSRLQ